MTLKNGSYNLTQSVLASLHNRDIDHCVSCGKQLELYDEVTSKRSGNNLRIRCIPCSEKYHIWVRPQTRKRERNE